MAHVNPLLAKIFVNSSRPGDTSMCKQTRSSRVQQKASHLFGKITRLHISSKLGVRWLSTPLIWLIPFKNTWEHNSRKTKWLLGPMIIFWSLKWRHNNGYIVWNHWRLYYLLSRLLRRRSKKTSTIRGTGFCGENSPATGDFSAHRTSDAETISIWWRHHVMHRCNILSQITSA